MPIDRDQARCFMPYPAPADLPVSYPGGALAGLTFAVKDIYDVAGYPTGCGNPHRLALSGIKTRSAAAVEALLAAGADFVGKVCTDELAFSMNGQNAHYGTPLNGAAPTRIPGGSSSGSASAVSNGLCDFALGSDTGGSVRTPASHCGLIGLRPTHDRISLAGTMMLASAFDTCGWFARDMDIFERVGAVLLGEDSAPLAPQPRLLIPEDVLALLPQASRAVFQQTLTRLAPVLAHGEPVQAASPTFDALYWAFRHIQGYQAWQEHGPIIERYGLQLGPGVKERFAWSSTITQAQWHEHRQVQQQFSEYFISLMGDGVMVLPTVPDAAPLLSDTEAALEDYRNRAIRMLCLAGLAGLPQISLPLMRLHDAPYGLSLIGPAGSDRALVALARRVCDQLTQG